MAADAWKELGERYEEAVELACHGNDEARVAGLRFLKDLGASATITRVLAGVRHRNRDG